MGRTLYTLGRLYPFHLGTVMQLDISHVFYTAALVVGLAALLSSGLLLLLGITRGRHLSTVYDGGGGGGGDVYVGRWAARHAILRNAVLSAVRLCMQLVGTDTPILRTERCINDCT